MLRSSLRKSILKSNQKSIRFNISTNGSNKLEDCIHTLTPFFNSINLKFSYFSHSWPIMVLGTDKDDQQVAIEAFLKRFHLRNDFLPHKIILKFLKNELAINDDCFQNICELNRRFKNFKINPQLAAFLLDNRNANSAQAGNLETFVDSLELLEIENHVTNEFLRCYLECEGVVTIKTFILVVKLAEKARVIRELFKKFGTLQEILFTSEYIDIDLNRNLIEMFLSEIVSRSNYLKNTIDDPFYDLCLTKNDYKLVLTLILNKKLVKGRLKEILNELKLAELSTGILNEKTFGYLLQMQNFKVHEGNLKKIKMHYLNEIRGISLIKPEQMGVLLQLNESRFNVKRILNYDKNSFTNKIIENELM